MNEMGSTGRWPIVQVLPKPRSERSMVNPRGLESSAVVGISGDLSVVHRRHRSLYNLGSRQSVHMNDCELIMQATSMWIANLRTRRIRDSLQIKRLLSARAATRVWRFARKPEAFRTHTVSHGFTRTRSSFHTHRYSMFHTHSLFHTHICLCTSTYCPGDSL